MDSRHAVIRYVVGGMAPGADDLLPVRRAVQEVAAKTKATGLDVPYVGTALPFKETRLYPGRRTDWVLGPAENDPLFRRRDAVPRAERQRIKTIQQAVGFKPEQIYVGHEVAKLGNNVPAIRHSHYRELTPEVARDVIALPDHWSTTASRSLVRGGKALARAGDAAAASTAVGVREIGQALRQRLGQLDPVVFGVMPTEYGIAAWFLLARWDA